MFQLSKTQLLAYKLTEEQVNALFNPDPIIINNSLNWLDSGTDKHIICYDDDRYPKQLKEISSPPLLLYLQGNLSLLNTAQIALVGSRSCTPYGREKAYLFAGQLSEAGFTITSGLALGIDGLAHQGALDKQGGTIAVLGTGLNNIYPKRHAQLAQQIIEQGLLISEFRPDTVAYPANFPRRNRIISGLSLGVLVIEASQRSGSLITARYAVEQNREVFALPGSIDNSEACGCHQLIQQGAKLVVNSQDICEEFKHLSINIVTAVQPENNNEEAHPLLKYIDFHLTTLEQLLNRSALDIVSLQNQLIELEITGRISVTAEGYIKLKH
ncbi:DNA-processing protein DprA [Psychromonas ossibalaenae]|uniref:DNA-processing protein DprA n=1 Tax=Psychromonas ossibalaenae TaxID=444922 RepID=UPI00035FA9B1|nr:DNA-processing protein DprA [Psychromonas ossibalaenae]